MHKLEGIACIIFRTAKTETNSRSLGQTMLHCTKSEGRFGLKNANNSGVLATVWWVGIHLLLLQSVPFGPGVHPASC